MHQRDRQTDRQTASTSSICLSRILLFSSSAMLCSQSLITYSRYVFYYSSPSSSPTLSLSLLLPFFLPSLSTYRTRRMSKIIVLSAVIEHCTTGTGVLLSYFFYSSFLVPIIQWSFLLLLYESPNILLSFSLSISLSHSLSLSLSLSLSI